MLLDRVDVRVQRCFADASTEIVDRAIDWQRGRARRGGLVPRRLARGRWDTVTERLRHRNDTVTTPERHHARHRQKNDTETPFSGAKSRRKAAFQARSATTPCEKVISRCNYTAADARSRVARSVEGVSGCLRPDSYRADARRWSVKRSAARLPAFGEVSI